MRPAGVIRLLPPIALVSGITFVVLRLYGRFDEYRAGTLVEIPKESFAAGLLGLTCFLLYAVTSILILVSVLTRRGRPIWLLAIALPIAAMIVVSNIPLPNWRDAAIAKLKEEVSEETLIDFAREARRAAEALHAKEDKQPAIYSFSCPALEKLPEGLRSFEGVGGVAVKPRCTVIIDHGIVDVGYGYGRARWALFIADAVPSDDRNPLARFERLYDRVWFTTTFSPPIE
jgi:hypothetical protein